MPKLFTPFLALIFSLLLFVSFMAPCYADTPVSLDKFAELPILHDGRIKPLDSFARIELKEFSGKESLDKEPAIGWLARTIFDPAAATNDKIFRITSETTRHALGLEDRKTPLYSFVEISSGLQKTTKLAEDYVSIPQKDQTQEQKDLLSVHDRASEYTSILRSLSALLPLNVSLPPIWEKRAGINPSQDVTYLALKKIEPDIEEALRALIKAKGKNPERYTNAEQGLAMLGLQLRVIGTAGQNNTLFRVIGPLTNTNGADAQTFSSPWAIINEGLATPETVPLLHHWENLATSWQNDDTKKWDATLTTLESAYPNKKLTLEHIYNHFAPFTVAIFVFSLGLVLTCLCFTGISSLFYRAAFLTLTTGVLIQGAGILTRVYLMDRPPVGTLYESLLFVGLVAPLIALTMEWRFRNQIGLLAGAVAGAIIGLLSHSMAGDGDNMKMLGAVLNTQFWLSTHVLCITIGYGWCLVTSLLAHFLLIGNAIGKLPPEKQAQLSSAITILSLFSLLFTTVGTILGGIWADQSWGRFWGWDPKENGALLIVLWLAWLIHGKLAGQISPLLWTAGMGFLSVVVGIAWIGVNLLGVGLHSYGFIEGVFWGLGAFAVIELAVLGACLFSMNKKGDSHAA